VETGAYWDAERRKCDCYGDRDKIVNYEGMLPKCVEACVSEESEYDSWSGECYCYDDEARAGDNGVCDYRKNYIIS
jgi:hypothetical protein